MLDNRLTILPVAVFIIAGILAILQRNPIVFAATTTSTSSITGWLVPDTSHLNNALMPIIMPLGGVGAFVWFARYLKRQGDEVVWWVLWGAFLGSIGADLSVGNGAAAALVPFGISAVLGILLFLWWWNS